MYALLGVAALLGGVAILSAKEYDKRPGGRDDMYYRSKSILTSSSITKSIDALANLDARDNARLYLKGLSTQLANSLNDERVSLMSTQGNDKDVSSGMKVVLNKIKALLKAVEKLRFLSENEIINAVSNHPMRVGTSPEGVSGVEGTEKWLLGGLRAEIEKQREIDENAEKKIRSCITCGNGLAEKAKNAVLYKILERIPTPHFAPRFPFEDALLSLQHLDNKVIEYEAYSDKSMRGGSSDSVPTSIGDMHDYVVDIARNINKE